MSLSYLPGLPELSVDLISSGGLTSQEPLGFSRLGIPILLECHNPHQYTDHEDYPSAQSLIKQTYRYKKQVTKMLPRIWIRNIQRLLRIRTHRRY
jgi:hypothetical protein